MDPRVIEWARYVDQIHLPSVVKQARVRTDGAKGAGESRSSRLRRQVLSPNRQMAAFDLENTLIASNVVTSYAWLASRRLPREDKVRLSLGLIREAPRLLKLDRADRSDFLRHFYRRYEDAPVDQVREDSAEMLSDLILTKSFPAAIRRVREHRALGHRTVLITGALDFVVEPLAPAVRRHRVRHDDGRGRPLHRADAARRRRPARAGRPRSYDYADAEGIDLSEAVAYADSANDLPMLEVVGFPVAVNPETRLAAIARKRGWLVEEWEKATGGAGLAAAAGRPPRTRAGAPVKAVLFERKPTRYAAAAVAGRIVPGRGASVGPLRLADVDPPEPPADGWVRLRPRLAGICGSDLATIDGRSSRYFEPIVSLPVHPGPRGGG